MLIFAGQGFTLMVSRFVHLHLHTEYSLVDGLVRIPALINTCVSKKMPAVAVTDHLNLFSCVKFFKAALSQGIKPILGAELLLAHPDHPTKSHEFVALCQNQQGYQNLLQLVSLAFIESPATTPMLRREWLKDRSEGLIILSGGTRGEIGQALLNGNEKQAQQSLNFWLETYPNSFYIEIIRTGRQQENEYNEAILAIACQKGIPVVASNDVRFICSDDFEAHEARVCIHQGRVLNDHSRPKIYSQEQYLRTPEEMAERFADIPSVLDNSVEIAKRCNVWMSLDKVYLPAFPTPKGENLDDFFIQTSLQGLEQRLKNHIFSENSKNNTPKKLDFYDKRLRHEMEVIISMGYAGYFLIVADFIRWAREHGIPVGPGRGSGAGSLVAYALKITDLDPIQYDLLFERFLNPERVSMPDFDIDFCMEGRDRVIDYVVSRYGRENVSQIITFGTMAARAVVRDVGRVLGHPYGFVDKIAKLIPFELGMTLDKALAQEVLLRTQYEKDEEVKVLIDLAKRLEGVARNAGKHAGGVVIAPSRLTDFVPLFCETGSSQWVSQFDKDDVEAIGLVKFDFLGLRTLTIINWALQTINTQRILDTDTTASNLSDLLSIENIPLNDSTTFERLQHCATKGVFQLESRGMRDLIKRLKPDCFEDIIALVALFRPGPLQSGMVDDFILRKHGRATIEYLHPELEAILRPTYGVILYQEQVMQIAQVLAGYTLGSADILRRAMGKKKPKEMAQQREIFVAGAQKRSVSKAIAEEIFDQMEKFAGYGFNKSHSAAYALISYQTAWLKTHYPAAFMAAVLSAEMNNTDKMVEFIHECKRLNLKVLPPDIDHSQYHFTLLNEQTILYGLGAIKGVGEGAIETIISNRQGKFIDLFDFCIRIDLSKMNRRVLESLIKAGAMDNLGAHRASLLASLEIALKQAEQHAENTLRGQEDIFGFAMKSDTNIDANIKHQHQNHYVVIPDWSRQDRLLFEKETLGLYISGHPFDNVRKELLNLTSGEIADLPLDKNQTIILAGLIISLRTLLTRRNEKFAFITLDDGSERIELAVFADAYKKFQHLLIQNQPIMVEAEVDYDSENDHYRLNSKTIYSLEQVRQKFAKALVIKLPNTDCEPPLIDKLIDKLKVALSAAKNGHCSVLFEYRTHGLRGFIKIGKEWRVGLNESLLQTLRSLVGDESIEVRYTLR